MKISNFKRNAENAIENGVIIIDPLNTYICDDVIIGKNTVIYPGCYIEGNTKIAENCIIGPNTRIIDSEIGEAAIVESSKVIESVIKDECKIGPFAHIRPNSQVGEKSKVGSFVEIKKVDIGKNTKIPHLSYAGDSTIGNDVEFACGAIISNMDTHYKKHKTIIEDNAFIGANSVLVSPVVIGKEAVVAANTTVTKDLEEKALIVTRADARIKEKYRK